jgi:hypothetical protein
MTEHLAYGGMTEIIHRFAVLDPRIDDSDPVLKERRKVAACKVTVLVYGHPEYRAAVIAIPGRIVRAATEE